MVKSPVKSITLIPGSKSEFTLIGLAWIKTPAVPRHCRDDACQNMTRWPRFDSDIPGHVGTLVRIDTYLVLRHLKLERVGLFSKILRNVYFHERSIQGRHRKFVHSPAPNLTIIKSIFIPTIWTPKHHKCHLCILTKCI